MGAMQLPDDEDLKPIQKSDENELELQAGRGKGKAAAEVDGKEVRV